MKYLIVNADDFGASPGTNRGIIEAHGHGVVTSASLLVDTPWSEAAATLSGAAPDLSVGLHLQLDRMDERDLDGELRRQLDRFRELAGRLPTHLDSHHDVHGDSRVLPHVLRLGREHGLPVRRHSPARYCSKFYGQWGGETHLEQIGVTSLVRMLETQVHDGVTELSCHPGYGDPHLRSTYAAEREVEVRTLCDPALRQALAARRIHLVGFRDLLGLASTGWHSTRGGVDRD
ncbi:MAG TPA: ChbG/HpnK family deacetylase [Gemmatimonadales bacterium]|nr:ChbG/HpnK family deacetylase [Gemmatimonadales bacterium]